MRKERRKDNSLELSNLFWQGPCKKVLKDVLITTRWKVRLKMDHKPIMKKDKRQYEKEIIAFCTRDEDLTTMVKVF